VLWGIVGSVTASVDFTYVNLWYGTLAGSQLGWVGGDSGISVKGGELSIYPRPTSDIAAAGPSFLAAVGGPSVTKETHQIDTAPDFAVENLMYQLSPSPRRSWRSVGTPVTHFVWKAAEADGFSTSLGSGSLAIALLNTNVNSILIEGSADGNSGWTTVANFNAPVYTGLSWLRSGDVITVDVTVASTASRYFNFGDLVGGTIILTPGSLAGDFPVTILRQTEGTWRSAASGSAAEKTIQLIVDMSGIDPDEPGPTSGNGATLLPPSWVGIKHLNRTAVTSVSGATPSEYTYYRATIPANLITAEGYYRIGVLMIGTLAVAGQQWSWGSNKTRTPNSTTFTDASGVTRVRKYGPPIETMQMTWNEGLDQMRFMSGSPTPDWLSANAGAYPALANYQDAAWLTWGHMDYLDSGVTPVVVLSYIPDDAGSSAPVYVLDPKLFHYGRISSPIVNEMVIGNEQSSLIIRQGQVTVQGIP